MSGSISRTSASTGMSTGTEPAVILAHADGRDETLSFADISRESSQFAHYLAAQGVKAGDRVAVMLEPSRPFYVAIFGAIKLGAIAVPLFTLFGPDGIRLRVLDCSPKLLVTNAEKAPMAEGIPGRQGRRRQRADFMQALASQPAAFEATTRGDDYAIYQYTSGTTRELPEAVKHTHRAIVTLMLAALYGTGLRPGDRFFCPSSPAWGHGLWHGTLAPLALGLTIGAFSGKFNAERLLKALHDHKFTNLSAAATHYRMMRNCGTASNVLVFSRQAFLHRRADRQRDCRLCRADLRPSGLQHVRHHRDRRDPGQLSGREGFRRQAGVARQADPRRQGGSAGRERPRLPARRHG